MQAGRTEKILRQDPARDASLSIDDEGLKTIREILNRDRYWSLYALGDLAPAELPNCEWRFDQADREAVLLFYRAFDPPIFFATGPVMKVDSLLDQAPLPQALYLHTKSDLLDVVSGRYRDITTKRMRRMILMKPELPDPSGVESLGEKDLQEVLDLFSARNAKEEDGTFFLPALLTQGVYFGARVNGRLVAVAGTHLVNVAEGVAAIGNVFCHPAERGNGLGARVTGAVIHSLCALGIRTIGLNVGFDNDGAARLYRRLGFHEVCSYVEGIASGFRLGALGLGCRPNPK